MPREYVTERPRQVRTEEGTLVGQPAGVGGSITDPEELTLEQLRARRRAIAALQAGSAVQSLGGPSGPVAQIATAAPSYSPFQELLLQNFLGRTGGFRDLQSKPELPAFMSLQRGGLASGFIDPSWGLFPTPQVQSYGGGGLVEVLAKKRKKPPVEEAPAPTTPGGPWTRGPNFPGEWNWNTRPRQA